MMGPWDRLGWPCRVKGTRTGLFRFAGFPAATVAARLKPTFEKFCGDPDSSSQPRRARIKMANRNVGTTTFLFLDSELAIQGADWRLRPSSFGRLERTCKRSQNARSGTGLQDRIAVVGPLHDLKVNTREFTRAESETWERQFLSVDFLTFPCLSWSCRCSRWAIATRLRRPRHAHQRVVGVFC